MKLYAHREPAVGVMIEVVVAAPVRVVVYQSVGGQRHPFWVVEVKVCVVVATLAVVVAGLMVVVFTGAEVVAQAWL